MEEYQSSVTDCLAEIAEIKCSEILAHLLMKRVNIALCQKTEAYVFCVVPQLKVKRSTSSYITKKAPAL